MIFRQKYISSLFLLAIFFMMFDFLRIYPGVNISVYRILQTLILFLIVIFLFARRGLEFKLYNLTFLFLIGFLFITLLFIFFSFQIDNSLVEISRLAQFIFMAFIIFLFLKNIWKEEYWLYFAITMLLCGGLAGFSIIGDSLGITDFSAFYVGRASIVTVRKFGILGEFNFAAGKLGIFLPFVLFLWQYYNQRNNLSKIVFIIIVLFILLFAIFLTGSRMGGIIAIFTILMFIFRERHKFLKLRIFIITMLIIIILLVFNKSFNLINLFPTDFILNRYADFNLYITNRIQDLSDASLTERADLFIMGLKMFNDYPLFGVGLGNYLYKIGEYGSYNFAYSHNTFVSILAETGFIGFILFIALFMQIGKNIYYYYCKSSYNDFYFYLGLSFINCVIMLFFLSDFGNKYFWGMFVPISMYFDHKKIYIK